MLQIVLYVQTVNGADYGHQRHNETEYHRKTVNSSKGKRPFTHESDYSMHAGVPAEIDHVQKGEDRNTAEIDFSKRLFDKWQNKSATYQNQSRMDKTSCHSNPLGS